MTSDPRAALAALVSALERHLELAAAQHRADDPAIRAAYEQIGDTFVAYDDALLDAYGEVTPLDIYTDDDDDLEELEDEELDDLDDELDEDDEEDDDEEEDDDDDDWDDEDDDDDDDDDEDDVEDDTEEDDDAEDNDEGRRR